MSEPSRDLVFSDLVEAWARVRDPRMQGSLAYEFYEVMADTFGCDLRRVPNPPPVAPEWLGGAIERIERRYGGRYPTRWARRVHEFVVRYAEPRHGTRNPFARFLEMDDVTRAIRDRDPGIDLTTPAGRLRWEAVIAGLFADLYPEAAARTVSWQQVYELGFATKGGKLTCGWYREDGPPWAAAPAASSGIESDGDGDARVAEQAAPPSPEAAALLDRSWRGHELWQDWVDGRIPGFPDDDSALLDAQSGLRR
ncbi:hypothetical protein [Capillimicrobium parvum]|uniref:Uncharacterized protein n=1 Tax=Capillimicrobium parvum TaxID=2884022 RepID=A0A9E6XV16_9ACTN|nr:hypothetical protein [Capillimicrobium parvum]UGS34705.1 hypothetical protein DSM104329_01087 [Capillimicrobium parvum]